MQVISETRRAQYIRYHVFIDFIFQVFLMIIYAFNICTINIFRSKKINLNRE
jgi:hypothetical protein